MQDKTTLGISDTFREYIEALVEEVVINGGSFDAQKKWLRKNSEAEGVSYETIENNLNDLFEAIKELEGHESKFVEHSVRALTKECYLSEALVNKLIDNAATIRRQKEEAERREKKERERKAQEEAERKSREEQDRIAREKAQWQKKLDAERKAKEEAERLALAAEQARKEAERKAREERGRIAREREAERLAKEKRERKAREEAERKAKEEKKQREDIEHKVKKIIAGRFDVEESALSDSTSFINDLWWIDSLEIVKLIMDFEREFGLNAADEDLSEIYTVGDVINMVVKKLGR